MELLIILFIVICVLAYIFRKPSVPKDYQIGSQEWKDEIAKEVRDSRPDIEDNSHLKNDLARTEDALTRAMQEIGRLQSSVDLTQRALETKSHQFVELSQRFDKLQHQKKSSEVKTGAFVEVLAPLAQQFPVDPKTMRFLGAPIDYISFCYETDKITFVEVKSGQSSLNENQRRIKKMIENGRVEFVEVRLNEQGIKVK